MDTLRILIADDHPLFRDGVAALLASIPDMELVGQARTGAEAIRLAEELQPDVILMDLNMPDGNGISAATQILRTSPHIGILIVTMFEDDDSLFAAMKVGVRGYLLKGADQQETLRAIQAVANGEAIFSPTIAQRLMRYFNTPQPKVSEPVLPVLTEREREILILLAQGQDCAQIATDLALSQKTVRNHLSNIFNKLQVTDRTQAVLLALKAGLTTRD
ncbi:MAG: response regulator transcription factor [Ardenticatenales bacterium]|nr:response regulator transcription factor [Ardenticatenales bacterium]